MSELSLVINSLIWVLKGFDFLFTYDTIWLGKDERWN